MDHEKVMRGVKNMETTIFEGNRIYYNFIRPHEGFRGEDAGGDGGIGIDGKNKWLELMIRSTGGDEKAHYSISYIYFSCKSFKY